MKVNSAGSQAVNAANDNKAPSSAKAPKGESAKKASIQSLENAEISPRGREFARASETAAKAPDVREERVQEIKARIQNGTYNVSPDQIADRLVEEHLSTLAK